jgi:hypothetical protein
MTEADKGMLNTGLEPYPPDHFAEAIANSGETEFMVLSRGGMEEMFCGKAVRKAQR